jgi:hypothetical protein
MKRRPRHVFANKPKFCCGLKPALIMVKCPTCGLPHEEYFGPPDRDEKAAEVQLLRQELSAAMAIIVDRMDDPRHGRPERRQMKARAVRSSRH